MKILENEYTGTLHIVLITETTHWSDGEDEISRAPVACSYVKGGDMFWSENYTEENISGDVDIEDVDTDRLCGHCIRIKIRRVLEKYQSWGFDVDLRHEDYSNESVRDTNFKTHEIATEPEEIRRIKEKNHA